MDLILYLFSKTHFFQRNELARPLMGTTHGVLRYGWKQVNRNISLDNSSIRNLNVLDFYAV